MKSTEQENRPRLYITDKKVICEHEFRIPGLDASLCGKCGKWVITDLQLIERLKYGNGNRKKRGQKNKSDTRGSFLA